MVATVWMAMLVVLVATVMKSTSVALDTMVTMKLMVEAPRPPSFCRVSRPSRSR